MCRDVRPDLPTPRRCEFDQVVRGASYSGPHTSKEILPSLDHITITRPTVSGGNWDPFVDFLSRRAAFGNRISSLKLSDYLDMDENVVEGIKRVVKAFQGEGNDEDGS